MAYTPTINTKGYWKLDGNSLDSSGLGNNGTDTAINYVAGRLGQCASFNGTSSFIKIPENNILGTSYTLSFWIKPVSASNDGRIITSATDKGTSLGYTDLNFQVLLTGGSLQWVATKASPNTDYSVTQSGFISTSTYTYCTLVYDNTAKTGSMYINGILNNSASLPNGVNVLKLPVFLGRINSYYNNYYNGLIDEVIIEDRAWSATEVRNYYSSFYTANAVGRTRYRDELGQVDSVGAFA